MECRLLYLVGHLGSGGLERQLCYLLQAMDRKRYQPAVAVWSFREEDAHVPQIRALGVPLYSFPGAPSGTAKLAAFSHLVGQLQPEVVHSYSFYTNFAAWWATLGSQMIPIGSIRQDFITELLPVPVTGDWHRAADGRPGVRPAQCPLPGDADL